MRCYANVTVVTSTQQAQLLVRGLRCGFITLTTAEEIRRAITHHTQLDYFITDSTAPKTHDVHCYPAII